MASAFREDLYVSRVACRVQHVHGLKFAFRPLASFSMLPLSAYSSIFDSSSTNIETDVVLCFWTSVGSSSSFNEIWCQFHNFTRKCFHIDRLASIFVKLIERSWTESEIELKPRQISRQLKEQAWKSCCWQLKVWRTLNHQNFTQLDVISARCPTLSSRIASEAINPQPGGEGSSASHFHFLDFATSRLEVGPMLSGVESLKRRRKKRSNCCVHK